LFGIKIIYSSITYLIKYITHNNWQLLADETNIILHNKASDLLMNYENEVPEDIRKMILLCSIKEIHELYKSKKVTAKQVLISFVLQTCKIGISHNLITDINLTKALLQAENADNIIKSNINQKDWPELLGIPISIKDHIHVEGFVSDLHLLEII